MYDFFLRVVRIKSFARRIWTKPRWPVMVARCVANAIQTLPVSVLDISARDVQMYLWKVYSGL